MRPTVFYQVGNLYLLDITPFGHLREICELEDMNEWKTQLCVLGFLLLNIFLGVIGTFWFRTQQRRKEVALRLAMGSSRRGIFSYLMYEGILLLTLAALPAAVIAFNIGYAELVDVGKMPFDAVRFFIGSRFDMDAYGADDCCRNLVSRLWSDESTSGRGIAR